MNRVVIVDDETIVRVTLRALLRWEEFGFTVAADFPDGRPALEYLKNHRADLLITDMKMPGLDGIALMEQLQKEGKLPVTIALSGYNEFELVREAFRVGAFDYLLKSDLNEESLKKLLQKLNEKIFVESSRNRADGGAAGNIAAFGFEKLEGEHGIVVFAVDEPQKQTARFGENLEEMLQKPVLELARQLPRVAARGKLEAVDPFHYVLLYRAGDRNQYRHTILSVVRQLQSVWRDYMNLPVSAAVSLPAEGEEALLEALERTSRMMYLTVLAGRSAVCTEWDCAGELIWYQEESREAGELVRGLYAADQAAVRREKERYFARLAGMELSEARGRSLMLAALLAYQFRQYEDDFFGLFPEEVDYREKINRLQTERELELWLNNYFRWVTDYIENRHDDRQADMILRAKRFLNDNYANPELTLKSAADYVGLNEKYFTSRFTREAGMTFTAYLTDLRMQKAKSLMASTDLKMYEISERVGYHNVEHFNRVFRKSFGTSPGDYRKSVKQ
ncbi:MAG: response regulator [Lachnospiraceae bacterium]|nr:response regulator [Lachnospiraceae bacterium]